MALPGLDRAGAAFSMDGPLSSTLETILAATQAESEMRQRQVPLATLQREVVGREPTRGFARALAARPFGVIAEVKRRSPSMGQIAPDESLIEAAIETYASHPLVAGISVLTQTANFGGTIDDLKNVKRRTQSPAKPVLRKDFVFSEYEVWFSRWSGADAILLMANVVTDRAKFKALHDLANELGLDVLCEVHDEAEIALLPSSARVCGINSRRFKGVTFTTGPDAGASGGAAGPVRDTKTDLSVFSLFSALPANALKVAESGVSAENIGAVLAKYPFNAALIGTSLLKSGGSAAAMRAHLDQIQAEAAKTR